MEEAFDLAFLNLNPKVIIDAGANAGFASIYFAHAYPRARVFAIEPEENSCQMLLRNAEFYPNILPIRAALWSEEGELQITNPNSDKWSFQVNKLTKDKAAETIDAITMDKLLSMAKTDKIDIIKMDIEGAEAELFCANYENWLKKLM
jgi:FkbM family methyltransferase